MNIDDVKAARAEIAREYKIDQYDIIRNPGQFEGAGAFAPYYWASVLNGISDETRDDPNSEDGDCPIDYFKITAEEREAFPTLGAARFVGVFQDDCGFVHAVTCNDIDAHARAFFGC